MIMQDSFTELSRAFLNIDRNEECYSKWGNYHLATRTTKGIHLFELSHHLESLDKKIGYVETYIEVLTSSPARKLLRNTLGRDGLKNREIIDMMVDPAMWPHSERLVSERVSIHQFEFSPRDAIRRNNSAIAVLNNIGNVTIYMLQGCKWICAVDISSLVVEQFEKVHKSKPTNYDDLRQSVYELVSGVICWAPDLRDDDSYFVTGQKSGTLLFWSINGRKETVNVKCIGKIDFMFDEIIHLLWIPKPDNGFILICSTILGQVIALECQIREGKIVLIAPHKLWEHKDRMVANIFEFKMIDKNVLLFFNKHRHLVGQIIDDNLKILSQSVKNINEHRISDMVQHNNHFIITTVNFRIYKISYNWTGKELDVVFNVIELKDINPTTELYSINFSLNDTICALTTLDRKVLHRKEPLGLEIIFLRTGPDNTEIENLINNPKKQLTCYWDCIEFIRYKITKTKMLPPYDFNLLLSEGDTDAYKLKIYLIILRIYNNLVNNTKIPFGALPENSVERIEDKILAMHANSNIKKLYFIHSSGTSLSDFQKECFVGSKKYLQLYSHKYKQGLTDSATPDMLDLVRKKYKYTCQCCEEEINVFSCSNGHTSMFCTISFTPIESLDYLFCKYCNTTARLELLDDNPICPLCDSYLDSSFS